MTKVALLTALANEVVVGDNSGWTIKFDYQVWAAGKEFHIGDKLVFKYPVGAHNVHKVNAANFQDCVAPLEAIPLANIAMSEVGGQKLVITVLPEVGSPAPSPQALAPTSSTKGIASPGAHMLAAVALVTMTVIT
ncbi:hypothetical protein GIB67_000262 [Kingdonia uniflora]|uniref:Phytocyanin domain-containing protein n=1 Tax=Kingdonia uniflora TaxID=39325 RepID=A0A7J7LCG3_9MAGN|nr:hypothetical protein GIB67_000262 [Kingdonia uniflora]